MLFTILIDFFKQLGLIGFCRAGNRSFDFLFQIGFGFDMGRIHKNYLGFKVTGSFNFRQNPGEDLFHHGLGKTVSKGVANGREMRNRFIQWNAQKPPISNVHLNVPNRLPQ